MRKEKSKRPGQRMALYYKSPSMRPSRALFLEKNGNSVYNAIVSVHRLNVEIGA